ncbi:hypothetical protein [Nocardia sp. NPDC057272]|uniref:hypothetical protein n=1 Tax=Nocardia sp. NPDC057272 TaxID=3346079 RepID=UPI003633923E
MPVTEGREQGKPWTEVRPNGQTVEYTIPEGNGKNTVDAIVRDSTGKVVSTARIVSIEGTAKYIRWQDDVGAGSSYFESGGPNELGYGQHFAPGTSTSGIPNWIFETSPDLSKARTLSIDSDGRVVGVDIGVRNSQGLYDNIHVDNFGNATVSSTRLTPGGQLESKFTGQMFTNRSGWLIDEQDNHWQGEPDKDGNQSWLRVENGHTYRMNYLGVITDFSLGKDGRPRLDTIFPDGSQTTQSGRTTIHFDANGNEAWRKEIGAPVQPWDTRAWNATKRGLSSFGSLISDTVGAPFHMARDGMQGISSVRVDQYGTFHVTYDAPNRFANAGTAAVGLAKGAAMFYLALPKYAVMQGYDTLRGSDLVRGSTTYQPPDREDELVKDLTGIPLKQWKDDTVGSVFEFGTATAASVLLFRAAGVGRPGGTRPTSVHSRSSIGNTATRYLDGRKISPKVLVEEIASKIGNYGREKLGQLENWSSRPAKSVEVITRVLAEFLENTGPSGLVAEGGAGRVSARSPVEPKAFAATQRADRGSDGARQPDTSAPQIGAPNQKGIESSIRKALASTAVKPGDIPKIAKTLAEHPLGYEIAELVSSGRYHGMRNFSTVASSLVRPDMLAGALEQLRLAERLSAAGVKEVSFEVKAGDTIRPGLSAGKATDLDVLAVDSAGTTFGWQFKAVRSENPKKVIDNAFKAAQQVVESGVDIKTVVIDTNLTLELIEPFRARLDLLYQQSSVQVMVRASDGSILVPKNGRFMPGGER